MKSVVLIFGLYCLVACQSHYPDQVNEALQQAGDNRAALESVIAYYAMPPIDSQKLKAAYFLIEHMPLHYSQQSAQRDLISELLLDNLSKISDSVRQLISINGTVGKVLDSLIQQHGVIPNTIVRDIDTLKSTYLIRHIEEAFNSWQNGKFSSQYNFKQFCEYILPYRSSTEPPEEWIGYMQLSYNWLVDSINSINDLSESPFMDSIMNDVRINNGFNSFPTLGLSEMIKGKFGNCQDRVTYATYALRAQGIPATFDLTLIDSHSWPVSIDSSNTLISSDVYGSFHRLNRKLPKVYRFMYSRQPNPLLLQANNDYSKIPPFFRVPNLADVTEQYCPTTDVTLRITTQPQEFHPFLCSYNDRRKEWIPVQWGKVRNDSIVFPTMGMGARRYSEVDRDSSFEQANREANIGAGIVYMAHYYTENNLIPSHYPLILRSDTTIHHLIPDTVRTQTVRLTRKYPNWRPHKLKWAKSMVGGVFQGANKSDFSDAVDLYSITQKPSEHQERIDVSSGRFRYVRYMTRPSTPANIAEMAFYGINGHALRGKVIGIDGPPDQSIDQVFDENPLTFYVGSLQRYRQTSWVGLDFGEPQLVTGFAFQVRNDGNTVQFGDEYELFYQDQRGWQSLGKKIADTTSLVYTHVPGNALFILRNHTRGREEQAFTYENGQQVWW